MTSGEIEMTGALQHSSLNGAQTVAPLAQFFIPAAASLQERRPRTLKHGDTFAVFDHNGDVLSGPGSPEGLFHRDTRYLSQYYLTICGERPMLLSSTLRDDNATLTCDLTNPDLHDEMGRCLIAHDSIHMRRTRFLWQGCCYERLALRNFDETAHDITLEIAFEADFADIFEVRGAQRPERGRQLLPEVNAAHVLLSYRGLDHNPRSTALRFDPTPARLEAGKAVYRLTLAPGEARSLFIEIGCDVNGVEDPPSQLFFRSLREARHALRRSSSRAAAVQSSNEIFNETIRRSISDLYMLMTDTETGPYPYAGVPWFSTVFGRDALITAWEMLWLDPAVARGVLLHLAENQARELDPDTDAEPGKILHEVRYGEMAETGEVPFRRYYGSVDSTPLFVMLAGAYFERTGDRAGLERLWPHIRKAIDWIERHGDRDGDGFIEYGRRNDNGLTNQGWKDSHDAVFHADGRLAKGPIALCEVQGYVHAARLAAAQMARELGDDAFALSQERKAEKLKASFDSTFWDDEMGTYVLALDGDKRPCRVRSSNTGHLLWTGIVRRDRADRLVHGLMGPSSFCGWGIRTVAACQARYNPMSYHNGSVWPHDNALIGAGLARYGFRAEAARIFEGIFSAATYIDLRRLPELFCGFPRRDTQGPTFYPVACTPQAWAAGAPLLLLQACLGLRLDAQAGQVIFDQPILPEFLGEVELRNLRLGEGTVDIALRRSGDHHVSADILRRDGPVRVIVTI
ncbi:amylo-alpha-1,6-glucosidase [Paracoccus seriniphilus]|uniref:amylo-alpha-1,6-glucosidase n=1 Tax=Paracoccus seriniphilus TaxID=184748 RepID=UPI003569AE92